MTLRFRVLGIPVPQGSTRAFIVRGKPIITSASKGLGAWRNAIAASVEGRTVPNGGAFGVTLEFVLPRPKTLPKKVSHHIKRPDVDKLCRAALDALTHIVWNDDSQVVYLSVTKTYATPDRPPGLFGEIRSEEG